MRYKIHYLHAPEVIQTDTYFARIIDTFGDFSGILVISRVNKSINQFKEHYGLTDRQFEIVKLLLNGQSNQEIAEGLELSKRTIESHISTIYGKLLINNKIELFNLITNFREP